MTFRLRVAPEASAEVSTAIAWTREHRGVDAAGTTIRARRLQTAPYSILYQVDDDLVTVLVIAHWKRNPASWRERLK
jgi:hypothetical protein